jgi:hypothetical protein
VERRVCKVFSEISVLSFLQPFTIFFSFSFLLLVNSYYLLINLLFIIFLFF